jgi:DNA-binding NarL/FixJ family response regulator
MNPITILLAEDHQTVREGIRDLLKAQSDIEVVGEAENGRQAVAFASKLCPDVVIMDISMPLISGMEATRQILEATPSTKVLVLSSHNDAAYVEQAKALGAAGYLVKQSDSHALPGAIREAHEGKPFICPSLPTIPEITP